MTLVFHRSSSSKLTQSSEAALGVNAKIDIEAAINAVINVALGVSIDVSKIRYRGHIATPGSYWDCPWLLPLLSRTRRLTNLPHRWTHRSIFRLAAQFKRPWNVSVKKWKASSVEDMPAPHSRSSTSCRTIPPCCSIIANALLFA